MAKSKHKQEYAIIGLGNFGTSVALRLEALGQSVLGIEINARRVNDLAGDLTDIMILDANDKEALEQADITSFHAVIVAIEEDFEANALITSSLKSMGVPYVICLARSNRHREILSRIGADRVVIPDEETGIRLADELSTPGLLYSLPLSPDYSLVEIQVPPRLVGRRIEESERETVIILMVLRSADLIFSPEIDFQFQAGDILVLAGEKRAITVFSSRL